MKNKTQKDLFNFLNKNKIPYAVLRGSDNESKKQNKDLDILISKSDYKKFKNKFPKTDRIVDFYLDKEKHFGFVFVPKSALQRRVFNKEKNFYVLSERDFSRMKRFRNFLKTGRKIKRLFGIYKIRNNLEVLSRNKKMFGLRYVFWDILYQIARRINNVKKKNLPLKKDFMEKRVNDYKMIIDKNGKGIHRDLFLKGTREESSVKIVRELLKPGQTILEAGANIGYYAILESKIVGKNGKVYAVEPVRENFKLLNKNINLNKLKNVKTFNLAFSDTDGKIEINISEDSNLNTPINIGESSRKEKVNCTTLDEFFKNKKYPDFMRMDIEGYEHIVFRGAEKTLDKLKTIFVELHFPLIQKDEMISFLKKLKQKNFEIHKAVMEWERLEDENSKLGKITNYLYKKRSKPVIYENLTIDKLLKNKDFLDGHLSLEVFFVKKR